MQINSTALRILMRTRRLRDGIQNALACSNVPRDQYCSDLSGGYGTLKFCVGISISFYDISLQLCFLVIIGVRFYGGLQLFFISHNW